MTPQGGDHARSCLTAQELAAIDRLGSHKQLAVELGLKPADVRTWWSRNNYRIQELAVRSDLSPPLFDVYAAAVILRERIAQRRDSR